MNELLQQAWQFREKIGYFHQTEALRVFHGPGEGQGPLSVLEIDRFGDYYWVTHWGARDSEVFQRTMKTEVVPFLQSKQAKAVVGISRSSEGGGAGEVIPFMGCAPPQQFSVREAGVQFLIQIQGTQQPGLFLDHFPLRIWLKNHCADMRVLNTFSYTGSLSVCAGLAGARQVVSVDLSKKVTQWAGRNWDLNALPTEKGEFIFGDVFEYLPRWVKKKEKFDCVILDPPSFSRGKVRNFSTAKDLDRLHSVAMELLTEDGVLISSINSSNQRRMDFDASLVRAGQKLGMKFRVLKTLELPETFPTYLGQEEDRYLKGSILKRVRGVL